MFFLGIGKDPLNGFLAFGIKLFVFRGVSGVIGQFFVVFPNMAQDSFNAVFRACLKSSNEDGNEGKRENLSRNIKFAFTIFPKSAEFVEPAEKTLYHPAAWQNDKLV